MKALVAGSVSLIGLVTVLAAADQVDMPMSSPLRPPGSWKAVVIVGVAVAAAAYLIGLWLLARLPAPVAGVLALAMAIQLAPLAVPPLLSTDIYTYWAYGRVGTAHGENPYEVPPSRFPEDPAVQRMGSNWKDRTTLYGPGFTLASEAHASAVGDSVDAAEWAYKGVAALAMMAIVGLAAFIAVRPAFAAAFVGWNPLLALHFAGGAHNDAWMVALVLAGLALASRGRPELGGAAWALAVAVKWVPLILLPLEWLANRRRGAALGLIGFAVAAAAIVAVAFGRYGVDWLTAGGGLSQQARATGSLGLSRLLGDIGFGHRATLATLAVGFAAVYGVLLFQAHRGRARLGLAAGAFAIAQGWLNPWYALWPIALSAAEEDRTARALSLALTVYLLRDVVPL